MESIATSTLLISLSAAALFVAASKILLAKTSRFPYPPGPKPTLFIGNALDIPLVDPGRVYMEWGKKFNSNIVHATVLGEHIVVINDLSSAEELFERRANIYSDRPELPVAEVLGWEYNVAALRYGDAWRQHRRICQQNFHKGAAKSYQPIQLEKVRIMLRGLLDNPVRFDDHSKMLSVSIALSMMYGYDVKTLDDPVIQFGEKSLMKGTRLLMPGTSMMSSLPFLRHIPSWVPFATEQKAAAEVKRLTEEMKRVPMDYVNAALKKGTAKPSFVTNFLEGKITNGASADETMMNNIAFTVYGAAVDTTISATGTFFYLIAKHPEVQRRAQAEIDRVIGNHRLPDFSDRPSLPYVEAIYREVMRYNPPLHLGAPHTLMEEDVYDGYLFPKGESPPRSSNASRYSTETRFYCICKHMVVAMSHDERVYPEPSAFKPERFLDAEGNLNDDSRILAYGFGRRICVGQHIASANMWITMVSVLGCFNLGKAKDELGNDIEINDEYDTNMVLSHKKPFKCSFEPRSDHIRQLIATAE